MTHPTHPAAALEPIETASRDELQTLQLEAPQVVAAPRVRQRPALSAHVRCGGRASDDLKSLADLAKFPFSTKHDLRDNYPFGLFAVPREQVVRVRVERHDGQADGGRLRA